MWSRSSGWLHAWWKETVWWLSPHPDRCGRGWWERGGEVCNWNCKRLKGLYVKKGLLVFSGLTVLRVAVDIVGNITSLTTRMHSSRMRTGAGHWLYAGVCSGGGCLLPGGRVCTCLWSRGYLPLSPGRYLPLVRGWLLWWVCIPACTEAGPPPPVNRITDTSKNITLARTSFAAGNYRKSKVWNNPWWTDPGKNLKRF